MSNGVRAYLAGLCHGVGVVWVVGYVLYRAAVPSSALFSPREGVLPLSLAMLSVMAGGLLMKINLPRGRPAEPATTPQQTPVP